VISLTTQAAADLPSFVLVFNNGKQLRVLFKLL